MKHRADIDYVRAIAVTGVVGFHASMILAGSLFAAGLNGVDIFFVISGFLIYGQLAAEHQRSGALDFRSFYVRRARRILPAVFFTVSLVLLMGWFYLLPEDYVTTAKASIATIGFLANIFYASELLNYFATSAQNIPLLHTWSLGVEEQFYLFAPVLFYLVFQGFTTAKSRVSVLAFLCVASFCTFYVSGAVPGALFYSPFVRAWELLLGAMAFELSDSRLPGRESTLITEGAWRPKVSGLLLCLLISYVVLAPGHTWSPLSVLPITLVTAALLCVNSGMKSDSPTGVGKALVEVGRASFSIYLFHFPVFSLFHYYHLTLEPLEVLLAVIVIYACGWVNFKTIETWGRFGASNRNVFLTLLTAMGLIVGFSLFVIATEGVPGKVRLDFNSDIIQTADYENEIARECQKTEIQFLDSQGCIFGEGELSYILIGDSHTIPAVPLLKDVAQTFGGAAMYLWTDGCPPLVDIYPLRRDGDHPSPQSKRCKLLNDDGIATVKSRPGEITVFMIARWDYYTDHSDQGQHQLLTSPAYELPTLDSTRQLFKEGLSRTLYAYAQYAKRIIIVLQVPDQDISPAYVKRALMTDAQDVSLNELINDLIGKSISTETHELRSQRTNRWLFNAIREVRAELNTSILIVDPTSVFCEDNQCPIANEQQIFYFDDDHASSVGFLRLKSEIFDALAAP